ncbi:omega-amidase [Dendrobium catenatum]|uniref:Omega-amidase n=1 Tax=Dendrobium catenatum TaxID=906689 RepID=A0A2I0VZ48_9ASPA|nr:omega-amidase [Dendrobium catenatum]
MHSCCCSSSSHSRRCKETPPYSRRTLSASGLACPTSIVPSSIAATTFIVGRIAVSSCRKHNAILTTIPNSSSVAFPSSLGSASSKYLPFSCFSKSHFKCLTGITKATSVDYCSSLYCYTRHGIVFKPEEARLSTTLQPLVPPVSKTTDKSRNIAHARRAIEEAASKGAQLVLFPVPNFTRKKKIPCISQGICIFLLPSNSGKQEPTS